MYKDSITVYLYEGFDVFFLSDQVLLKTLDSFVCLVKPLFVFLLIFSLLSIHATYRVHAYEYVETQTGVAISAPNIHLHAGNSTFGDTYKLSVKWTALQLLGTAMVDAFSNDVSACNKYAYQCPKLR